MQHLPKITCMAIDDEHFAIELLESFIKKIPHLNLIFSTTDAAEAIETIEVLKPQLIFLDIQMPLINGLSMVKKLKHKANVIFTTAYKQFALHAFEVEAIDYLVKPFAFERFEKAVQKATTLINSNNSLAIINEPQLLVRTNKTTLKIPTNTILFIEKASDYVYIHTTTEKHIALFTLQKLEEVLPPNQFVRIHKSYLISLNKIAKWDIENVYIQQHSLPIARARKSDVVKIFLDYNMQRGVLMK